MLGILNVLLLSIVSAMNYVVVEQQKNWTDAENFCQNQYGTHLATITDDASAIQLMNVWKGSLEITDGGWIGLNDLVEEGVWVYSDGSDCPTPDSNCGASYKYWDESQAPNDFGTGQDCGLVMGSKVEEDDYENMLNDMDCSRTFWFSCNLPLRTPAPITPSPITPAPVTPVPTTPAPISYPNCQYKKKYATTWTGVWKTWTDWYDSKVKKGRNEFLAEYPWCHKSDWSSLEFFYQFVYDENARTLTFYSQNCCGTDRQFGSDYRVNWVPNGYGSKYEYVPNEAWIDHNTPLYDYTCKYRKDYEITLPDKAWPTWQNYCNKWITKGRDAFLNEKPWCGYEDSLEFFYAFSYNSNAKQLTFYGHFCCGKENGQSLQFGAAYTKSGKIPNQGWYDHNPWAYEEECDQTDWA